MGNNSITTKTIGILGSGQLAKMMCQAATKIGMRTFIYSDKKGPANHVCDKNIIADYTDAEQIKIFCENVDLVTIEFENIPSIIIKTIKSNNIKCYPENTFLETIADRFYEKSMLENIGIDVAPFAKIKDEDDLFTFAKDHGFPFIIKTRKFGYDGKGQYKIDNEDDIKKFISENLSKETKEIFIAEAFINYSHEFSLLIARNKNNEFSYFDIVKNTHENGILRVSQSDKQTDILFENLKGQIHKFGEKVLSHSDYIGLMAIEFFLVGDKILVNEIAPRVHNSGHWTIEGAITSQFEQHIRAISDLDFGDTSRKGDVEMQNLIGDEINNIEKYYSDKNCSITIYGKDKWENGRKMGHLCWVKN